MHFFLKSLALAAIFCSISISSVQAEVFLVEDQNDRFEITFPDLWKQVSNQKPDDKLVVAGPGQNDHAICRVRVRDDRRYIIYPEKFSDSIQRLSVSKGFWKNYLGDYNDIRVDVFEDNRGLGRGAASMVEASFETSQGTIARKRGIMLASLYYDQIYVLDCSAEESVYEKWRPAFLGIIKSVDFDQVLFNDLNGHYRPFQDDETLEIVGPKPLDSYKH